jgi:hypothetical protein
MNAEYFLKIQKLDIKIAYKKFKYYNLFLFSF